MPAEDRVGLGALAGTAAASRARPCTPRGVIEIAAHTDELAMAQLGRPAADSGASFASLTAAAAGSAPRPAGAAAPPAGTRPQRPARRAAYWRAKATTNRGL